MRMDVDESNAPLNPMSGHVSSLYESYKQDKTLVVMPEQKFNWQINWEIW